MRERAAGAGGGARRIARPDERTTGSRRRPPADVAVLLDKEFVDVARALADPTRVQILRTIAASASLCCGAIGREVPVRPATVSHHLRVLAQAGLVDTQRDGQFINVRINAARLEQFRVALAAFATEAASTPVTLRRPSAGRQA